MKGRIRHPLVLAGALQSAAGPFAGVNGPACRSSRAQQLTRAEPNASLCRRAVRCPAPRDAQEESLQGDMVRVVIVCVRAEP
jgi:hypothetical protein